MTRRDDSNRFILSVTAFNHDTDTLLGFVIGLVAGITLARWLS
jgi:hypothetical protein